MSEMIVTTANEIPDKKVVEILGVVKGNTVRARNIGRDIGAGFKNIIGGEVKTYTDMTTNARDEAFNRMVLFFQILFLSRFLIFPLIF
ncbi:unnamed protein product [marine sediment metagenome]|uniref:Heavy metal-binding domain-containing protein n=1 Tax=marine sediment metagenome TaxID=412755 RepID=X1UV00_9ZZZZ